MCPVPLPTLPNAVPCQWCWCRGWELSQSLFALSCGTQLLFAKAPALCQGTWLSWVFGVAMPQALPHYAGLQQHPGRGLPWCGIHYAVPGGH